MQAYFEPEKAFSISMPKPVFEISKLLMKKHEISEEKMKTLMQFCEGFFRKYFRYLIGLVNVARKACRRNLL